MAKRPKLTNLSEIYRYFRKNQTPIYFLSPTPYNILGLGRWINRFEYINFFDSFDGTHPKALVPTEHGPHEFRSIEDVNNYLLQHKQVRDHIKARGGGKMLLVMFDEETEQLAKELKVEIALPRAKLRKHIDSKITTTRIGNDAGIKSAPNVMGKATSYAELMKLASGAKLGKDLVVQLPYGDSGRTTFFISKEADWAKNADKLADEELKVMKKIRHLPGTVEAVCTRHGTLAGPMQTDITGFGELTPYKGGWCGNDAFTGGMDKERAAVQTMARKLGDQLYKEGYKGAFCMDFLIDTDDGNVYLGEINPRISGASPLTNLITSTYGGCPIFLFHMLEFMNVDWEIDLEEGAEALGRVRQLEPAHPQAPDRRGGDHHQGARVRHLAHGQRRQYLAGQEVHRLVPGVGRGRGVLPARLHRRRLPLSRRRHGHSRLARAYADRHAQAEGARQEMGSGHQRPVPLLAPAQERPRARDPGRGFHQQDVLKLTSWCWCVAAPRPSRHRRARPGDPFRHGTGKQRASEKDARDQVRA